MRPTLSATPATLAAPSTPANSAPARIIVLVVALAVSLSACGNWVGKIEHVGRVGVSVDEAGAPVVVLAPCREGAAQVDIVLTRPADMPEDQENTPVGSWTATKANAERSELLVTEPGPGWSGEAVEPPAATTSWIVHAGYDSSENQTMGQVVVSGADLARLGQDRVLVSDGEQVVTEPRESFDGHCANN